MRPSTVTPALLLATTIAAAAVSAFLVATPLRKAIAVVQHCRQQHPRRRAMPPSTRHQLWARAQGDDGPGDDNLEELVERLLNGGGDRVDVEAWERRRRLGIEREHEEEKGLPGILKGFSRRLLANVPVLLFVPLVMLAAVQLSGIAIATAVIAALVVASFSLPVVALAFVVPIGLFLLLGTLAFPIIPFAVFTIAPSLAVLPLFIFLGWLFLQLATGPTVIRDDSLFNSFGGFPLEEWVRAEVKDEGGLAGAAGRKRRPAEKEDGVIDVEAEEDTDAEAEEQLRRFDERLRQGGRDQDGRGA